MKIEILFFLLFGNYFIVGGNMVKRVIKGYKAPEDQNRWAISLKGDLHKEKSVTVCGATLIDKQWLLSAAHCFLTIDGSTVSNQTDPSLWHIRAGARKLQTQYSKDEDKNKKIKEEGWHDEEENKNELLEELYKGLETQETQEIKRTVKRNGGGHIHLHIDRIWLHPNYRGAQIEWDIAIMKLTAPMEEKYIDTSVEVIELPEESDSKTWPIVRQKCQLMDWG